MLVASWRFKPEKALVGAFSVIVETEGSSAALYKTLCLNSKQSAFTRHSGCVLSAAAAGSRGHTEVQLFLRLPLIGGDGLDPGPVSQSAPSPGS